MCPRECSAWATTAENAWAPFRMNGSTRVSYSFCHTHFASSADTHLHALGNTEAIKVREKIAEECLDDMIEWLWNGGGQVGIYDGNNVTESRRREIYDKLIANDIHVSIE